ncbi:MAG: nucleotidyltransferase substrate binding protein [Magnetococcales bacterium]|nr:nucleotidyltransferase substrate binding protein [Magnetococcales bacterium]
MDDIRWKQRFDNFQKALVLLREVRERGVATLSEMEKEGAAQRFEFTFELAWKTLKDYMEYQGMNRVDSAPRQVIKTATGVGILKDSDIWLEMLLQRNQLAHRYDRRVFNTALDYLESRYHDAFERRHDFFLEKLVES